MGDAGWLTIKGKSTGTTQPEYEYQIPKGDARALIADHCADHVIKKIRYKISFYGYDWEVDEFTGNNSGLVIAEVEAKSKKERRWAEQNRPSWVDKDITKKYEYRNVNLAKNPFNKWGDSKGHDT